MTTTFDKREEGFEKKFAHDEELRFKATARRNKMLGLWAAEKLGLSGDAANAYAKEVVMKAWVYAYAHRRRKKRDFRRLWITRINAAARTNGTSYSRLMHGLKNKNVGLDRKVLSELAITDAAAFSEVTKLAAAK